MAAPSAGLVAFSHLQFSQSRGRQPYLIVQNILYVIRPAVPPGAGEESLATPIPLARLILRRGSTSRPSGEWNDDDYDFLADGVVAGRLIEAMAAPQARRSYGRSPLSIHSGRAGPSDPI